MMRVAAAQTPPRQHIPLPIIYIWSNTRLASGVEGGTFTYCTPYIAILLMINWMCKEAQN